MFKKLKRLIWGKKQEEKPPPFTEPSVSSEKKLDVVNKLDVVDEEDGKLINDAKMDVDTIISEVNEIKQELDKRIYLKKYLDPSDDDSSADQIESFNSVNKENVGETSQLKQDSDHELFNDTPDTNLYSYKSIYIGLWAEIIFIKRKYSETDKKDKDDDDDEETYKNKYKDKNQFIRNIKKHNALLNKYSEDFPEEHSFSYTLKKIFSDIQLLYYVYDNDDSSDKTTPYIKDDYIALRIEDRIENLGKNPDLYAVPVNLNKVDALIHKIETEFKDEVKFKYKVNGKINIGGVESLIKKVIKDQGPNIYKIFIINLMKYWITLKIYVEYFNVHGEYIGIGNDKILKLRELRDIIEFIIRSSDYEIQKNAMSNIPGSDCEFCLGSVDKFRQSAMNESAEGLHNDGGRRSGRRSSRRRRKTMNKQRKSKKARK